MQYIFFSKTNWREPPRIRHQLAKLLLSEGNEVLFFERPSYPWQPCLAAGVNSEIEQPALTRSKQLIHHQLRTSGLREMNEFYERYQIRKALKNVRNIDDAVIVNFNYEYYFLRKVFENNEIVTIINDDFIAQARVGYTKHLQSALRRTCEISDHVLAVSVPLVQQLSVYRKTSLFMPWADTPYRAPVKMAARKAVLFWGSVDSRLDIELIEKLSQRLPDIGIHLVGPLDSKTETALREIKAATVRVMPSSDLDDLDLTCYFCAIMPYKSGKQEIEAVTLANKSIRLLSRGLPLVVHGMPYFLDARPIFKAASHSQFIDLVTVARQRFDEIQGAAKELVEAHGARARYAQFTQMLDQ